MVDLYLEGKVGFGEMAKSAGGDVGVADCVSVSHFTGRAGTSHTTHPGTACHCRAGPDRQSAPHS